MLEVWWAQLSADSHCRLFADESARPVCRSKYFQSFEIHADRAMKPNKKLSFFSVKNFSKAGIAKPNLQGFFADQPPKKTAFSCAKFVQTLQFYPTMLDEAWLDQKVVKSQIWQTKSAGFSCRPVRRLNSFQLLKLQADMLCVYVVILHIAIRFDSVTRTYI